MSEESIPAEQVIEIDPDGRYVMIFPMRLTDEEFESYRATIDRWWNGEEGATPFLLADGGVQVIKLEKHGEEKE